MEGRQGRVVSGGRLVVCREMEGPWAGQCLSTVRKGWEWSGRPGGE